MTAWLAGRGAITSLGIGVGALLDGVWSGACGLRAPERLRDVPSTTAVLGEVPAVAIAPPHPWSPPALQLARAAGAEALAGWTSRGDTALVVATTKADHAEHHTRVGLRITPGESGRMAEELARALELGGPVASVSTACASGLSGLALAGRWLESGRARHALVVGVDALSGFVVQGFSGLLALDAGPCRPFDRARRGLSLGEGAGALLLTSDRDRGGPFALLGWGEANDANHVTGPRRDGAGLRLAVERALARAKLAPDAIDAVHLHGTGTPYNDAAEAIAVRDAFAGRSPPAFGSKAALGHTLGASGVIETLIAVEALARASAPANLRLADPDVDPALSLTRALTPLPRADAALKLAAGFGGIDAAVVVGRAC